MIDMEKTGSNIVKIAKMNNYSINKLADVLGISNVSIYKWKRGFNLPSIDNLYEMSKLFNCTIDDLIKEDA